MTALEEADLVELQGLLCQYENQRDYSTAGDLHRMIDELHARQIRRRQEYIKDRKLKEKQFKLKTHQRVINEFIRLWKQCIKEYDEMCSVYIDKEKLRHNSNLQSFYDCISQFLETSVSKITPPPSVLDRRRLPNIVTQYLEPVTT